MDLELQLGWVRRVWILKLGRARGVDLGWILKLGFVKGVDIAWILTFGWIFGES